MRLKKTYVYIFFGVIAIISGIVSFIFIRNIVQSRSTTPTITGDMPISQSTPSAPPFGIPRNRAEADKYPNWWIELQEKAVKTNFVTISNCIQKPQIAFFTPGENITLTNPGDTEQELYLSEAITLKIPAKGTLKRKADFGSGDFAYTVYCKGYVEPIGVFFVMDDST